MTSHNPGLILIPTEMERAILQPLLQHHGDADPRLSWRVELCGFGAIAAAATTALLVQQHAPRRVLLIGIAGRYTSHLAVGSAYGFQSVTQYGIGVGSGTSYRSTADLGWTPLESMSEMHDADTFPLDVPELDASSGSSHLAGQLLTVCSAAADEEDRQQRLAKYPNAMAEDMEGYAVALACYAAGVPLQIIRGISNDVGDRNKSHWQIEPALKSAMVVVRSANRT